MENSLSPAQNLDPLSVKFKKQEQIMVMPSHCPRLSAICVYTEHITFPCLTTSVITAVLELFYSMRRDYSIDIY